MSFKISYLYLFIFFFHILILILQRSKLRPVRMLIEIYRSYRRQCHEVAKMRSPFRYWAKVRSPFQCWGRLYRSYTQLLWEKYRPRFTKVLRLRPHGGVRDQWKNYFHFIFVINVLLLLLYIIIRLFKLC